MSAPETRLVYLFNRYYEKTATPQETKELMQLLYRAADDEQLATLIRQAWENLSIQKPVFSFEKSEEIIGKILKPGSSEECSYQDLKEKRLIPWRKITAAAVVIIAMGTGIYFWSGKASRKISVATSPANDISPGGNKATLILADGSTILLDKAREGVLATQGFTEIEKTGEGRLVYDTGIERNASPDFAFNTISTPKGGQFQVVLPDGSKVWLNAASSIRFPVTFTGNERKVEITGEVYFEVVKNETVPFKVIMDGAEVEVLGTVFNVMAYKNEAAVETTLLEGSVRITSEHPLPGTAGSEILSPGQQALLNRGGDLEVISNADMDGSIAWKNGLFQFRDAGIEDVMRQAARWYDIEVRYEGEIPRRQFTGKIPRSVNISELLNMLGYAGVNSRIEGREVIIMP